MTERDAIVEKAFIRLNDELCQYERATSRGGLLLYIPDHRDEEIVITQGGKPYIRLFYSHHDEKEELKSIFRMAIIRRFNSE